MNPTREREQAVVMRATIEAIHGILTEVLTMASILDTIDATPKMPSKAFPFRAKGAVESLIMFVVIHSEGIITTTRTIDGTPIDSVVQNHQTCATTTTTTEEIKTEIVDEVNDAQDFDIPSIETNCTLTCICFMSLFQPNAKNFTCTIKRLLVAIPTQPGT